MFNATGVLAGLLVLMAAVVVIDLVLKWLDTRFSYWKPAR
jgi:ABC-type nitrate/sulfonate/bicarbonate transport system permease component